MNCDKVLKLFNTRLVIINVGSKSFAAALEKQGYDTLQVDWKPLAGNDRQMQELLAILGI